MNRSGFRSLVTRSAFTLLELTLVVGLLAVMASSAVLILREPIRAARVRSGEATLMLLDSQLRQTAIRGQTVSLWIDLDRQILQRESGGLLGTSYPVPIRELRLAQQTSSSGRHELRYDRTGASPSFAVRWPTAAGDRSTFVCGGTGQFLALESSDDEAILQLP